MDLTTLSEGELSELARKLPEEIKRREEGKKLDFLAKMKELAREHGVDLQEFLGKENRPIRSGLGVKVKPKYRHPENASLTWTGRGRSPRWVEEYLQQTGGQLSDLLIV